MKINIISIILAFLIVGCSDLNNITSPPKSITKVNEFVLAEGRWKALPGTTTRTTSKMNFMSISCDHGKMTCIEILSCLFTPKDQPKSFDNNVLYHQKFTYQITEWRNDVIKAEWKAPVADVAITISLKDSFAEKSFRETKARGTETSNPDVYGKWVLE